MADPTGPTVERDPDDIDTPSSSEPVHGQTGSTPPASPTPQGSVGEKPGAPEAPPVDGTGTVAEPVEPDAHDTADAADGSTSLADGGPVAPPPVEDQAPASDAAPPIEEPVVEPVERAKADEHADGRAAEDELGGDDGEGDDGDDGGGGGGDDDLEGDGDGRRGSGGLLTKKVQIDARAILIVVAIVAMGVGAYVLGQRQAQDADTAATTPGASTPTTKFTLPKDFIAFEDKETGVKLAIPKDWEQYSTKELDPSYRLLVGVPNAKDNLRVRVNAYSSEITAANVNDQRAVVDAILQGEKVSILAAETLTLNGLPTLFYVYKFTDPAGEAGIHAHFFVFQGRKMVTMVFEAVPESRYPLLAPVFDQIKDSLVVAPGPPPSFLEELGKPNTTAPGTAPGATTVPPTSAPPATG